MTYKELEELIAGIGPVLKTYVAQQVAPLEQRLAALEGVAPVKAADKPRWKLRGEWASNAEYGRGDAVTRHQSMYVCDVGRSPGTNPATDPVCWRRVSGAAA